MRRITILSKSILSARVGAIIVFYLVFICLPTTLLPPFWDSVIGGYREALWLLDNNWDFQALAFQQLGFVGGGPRTYFVSLYWIATSLLLFLFSPKIVFSLIHLAILSSAVWILAETRRNALTVTKNAAIANLVGIALCCHPLFLAQSILFTPEVLLAACSLAFIRALKNGRNGIALLFVWLATLTKITGCFIGVAGCIPFFFLKRGTLSLLSLIGWLTLFLSPFLFSALFGAIENGLFYQGGFDAERTVDKFSAIASFFGFQSDKCDYILTHTPVIHVFLSVGNLIAGGFLVYKTKWSDPIILYHFSLILIFALFLSAWDIALPRYTVILLPSIFLIAAHFMSYRRYSPVQVWAVWLPTIFFSVLNFNEGLYRLTGLDSRSLNGHLIERTPLVFRAITIDREMAAVVENMSKSKSLPIIAGYPYQISLADSRYGYVSHDLPVVPIHRVFHKSGFKLLGRPALYIEVDNVFYDIGYCGVRGRLTPQADWLKQASWSINDEEVLTLSLIPSVSEATQQEIDQLTRNCEYHAFEPRRAFPQFSPSSLLQSAPTPPSAATTLHQ
jgi:hypothetical protein